MVTKSVSIRGPIVIAKTQITSDFEFKTYLNTNESLNRTALWFTDQILHDSIKVNDSLSTLLNSYSFISVHLDPA